MLSNLIIFAKKLSSIFGKNLFIFRLELEKMKIIKLIFPYSDQIPNEDFIYC